MSTLSSAESLLLVALDCEATLERTHACTDPQSDHNLLARTQAGDDAAFAELVARYRLSLTNYIHRLLNDYDAAVDLTQETFVRLYGARDRYHTNYAFSTYIYRIVTNLAISEMRKRRRRRLISLSAVFKSDEGQGAPAFDPADECPLPDAVLIRHQRQQAVRRAIASLPANYRIAVVLRDIEGRTYEEIALMLEVSEGTVKSRINRARSFLRQKLSAAEITGLSITLTGYGLQRLQTPTRYNSRTSVAERRLACARRSLPNVHCALAGAFVVK